MTSSFNPRPKRGAAPLWNTPLSGLRFGLTASLLPEMLAVGLFRPIPKLTSRVNLATP